jgi:hypothetical protein
MKQFGWVAIFMAVCLQGCAVAVPPKYKITVSKQNKTLAPDEWCSLTFTFTNTNTRSSQRNMWMEAFVLDAENKTIDARFVTFSTPPGGTDQKETLIYTSCDRVRQVAITGNGEIIEPNTFDWKE